MDEVPPVSGPLISKKNASPLGAMAAEQLAEAEKFKAEGNRQHQEGLLAENTGGKCPVLFWSNCNQKKDLDGPTVV